MRYNEVKAFNRRALGSWYSRRDFNDYMSMKKSNFYGKLSSCGRAFIGRKGAGWNKCKSALCCRCSRKWSLAQSRTLIKSFPTAQNKDFRFLTVGIGMTRDINKVFDIFNQFRTKLRYEINKRRNRKKSEFLPWRDLGLAGSLEIDSFISSDFYKLGSDKQTQYIKQYGYKPDISKSEYVWIVTAHIVLHLGMLSESDIDALVSPFCKLTHFTDLYVWKDVKTNIRDMIRYSSKCRYITKLAGNDFKFWELDQVRQYASIVMNARGRQPYKICIQRSGMRKRRTSIKCTDLIGPSITSNHSFIYRSA